MFSIKPLLDLFDIPPLRVLRRNLGDRLAVSKIHLGLSALTVFLLMWLFSNNIKITLILFVSTLALILVLFLISKLIFGGGRKLGLKPGNSWSLAIASIQKRANVNAVQLISFSLAIKLLLFLICQLTCLSVSAAYITKLSTHGVEITKFFTHESGAVSLYISGNVDNLDNCTSTFRVYIPHDLPGKDAMVSLALTAFVSGKKVGFHGSGGSTTHFWGGTVDVPIVNNMWIVK